MCAFSGLLAGFSSPGRALGSFLDGSNSVCINTGWPQVLSRQAHSHDLTGHLGRWSQLGPQAERRNRLRANALLVWHPECWQPQDELHKMEG